MLSDAGTRAAVGARDVVHPLAPASGDAQVQQFHALILVDGQDGQTRLAAPLTVAVERAGGTRDVGAKDADTDVPPLVLKEIPGEFDTGKEVLVQPGWLRNRTTAP